MAVQFVQLFKTHCFRNTMGFGRFLSSVKNQPKSTLFISGKRAVDTFVVVIPHLDFDKRFAELSELEENIKRRGLNLNVVEMKESWNFYKEWNKNKLQIQDNLKRAGVRMKELSGTEDSEGKDELENLERYRGLLSEELRLVKENVWHMEDNVICKLLNLPNVLHPETPEKGEVFFEFYQENIKEGWDHLRVGVELNCLEYHNELTCFLKNKAALFELAIAELIVNQFTEQGFVQFSNPDFTRSVLAEGVGLPPNASSELFLLENSENNNDRLHLCGGASLFPFCGFHAKQSVPNISLPVRYVAAGRRYTPETSALPGLYSVNQFTSVQIFTATSSQEELYHEFKSCVKILQNLFSDLGLKFKIVKQPPNLLKMWESLRISIQVYSPFNKVFVEVGNVSLIDDFISKRLRMYYSDKEGESFLKIVSGTVVNTHSLLALCLERSDNDLFIPDVMKEYMVR